MVVDPHGSCVGIVRGIIGVCLGLNCRSLYLHIILVRIGVSTWVSSAV